MTGPEATEGQEPEQPVTPGEAVPIQDPVIRDGVAYPQERARTPEEVARDREAADTAGPDSPDGPQEEASGEVAEPEPLANPQPGSQGTGNAEAPAAPPAEETPEPAAPEPEAPPFSAGGLDFKRSTSGDVVIQRVSNGVTVFTGVIDNPEWIRVVEYLGL